MSIHSKFKIGNDLSETKLPIKKSYANKIPEYIYIPTLNIVDYVKKNNQLFLLIELMNQLSKF